MFALIALFRVMSFVVGAIFFTAFGVGVLMALNCIESVVDSAQ